MKSPIKAIVSLVLSLILIVSISGCGEKAVGKDLSLNLGENPKRETAKLSAQISEVSPPGIIQELRSSLEVYQPQVKIVTPKPDEVLQNSTVKVNFQVRDLPIYKDANWGLGPHLHVILDNEPYKAVYDSSQSLELSDLAPGTHTLRVFASRPWHESFKNEGAYAQIRFHVFTKSDDNNPDPNLPLLSYSRPKGSYGAEPILLDFYLTNAPLHLVAKENSQNPSSDWRIRCTINDESFILDRWQSLYLKGFKPGQNWVKLEFLDNQGNPVKNVFNSTVRAIAYEPKGQDTLAKIVRGEVTAEQVRSIVEPNYRPKTPFIEPTPTSTPEPQEDQIPTIQPTVEPTPTSPDIEPTPEVTPIPEITPQPQKPESGRYFNRTPQQGESTPSVPPVLPKESRPGGFFNRFKRSKVAPPTPELEPTPTIPENIETPQSEEVPSIELEPTPPVIAPSPEESQPKGFFNRFERRQVAPPTPEIETPQPETEIKEKPEVTPSPKKSRFGKYLNPPQPTPDLPPTLPEIVKPTPEEPTLPQPRVEVTPEAQPRTTQRLQHYFNLPQRSTQIDPNPDAAQTKLIPEQNQKTILPDTSTQTIDN